MFDPKNNTRAISSERPKILGSDSKRARLAGELADLFVSRDTFVVDKKTHDKAANIQAKTSTASFYPRRFSFGPTQNPANKTRGFINWVAYATPNRSNKTSMTFFIKKTHLNASDSKLVGGEPGKVASSMVINFENIKDPEIKHKLDMRTLKEFKEGLTLHPNDTFRAMISLLVQKDYMRYGNFEGVAFNAKDLGKHIFTHANLSQAKFKNCVFRGLDFSNVDLTSSTFENCRFIDCIGTNIAGADSAKTPNTKITYTNTYDAETGLNLHIKTPIFDLNTHHIKTLDPQIADSCHGINVTETELGNNSKITQFILNNLENREALRSALAGMIWNEKTTIFFTPENPQDEKSVAAAIEINKKIFKALNSISIFSPSCKSRRKINDMIIPSDSDSIFSQLENIAQFQTYEFKIAGKDKTIKNLKGNLLTSATYIAVRSLVDDEGVDRKGKPISVPAVYIIKKNSKNDFNIFKLIRNDKTRKFDNIEEVGLATKNELISLIKGEKRLEEKLKLQKEPQPKTDTEEVSTKEDLQNTETEDQAPLEENN